MRQARGRTGVRRGPGGRRSPPARAVRSPRATNLHVGLSGSRKAPCWAWAMASPSSSGSRPRSQGETEASPSLSSEARSPSPRQPRRRTLASAGRGRDGVGGGFGSTWIPQYAAPLRPPKLRPRRDVGDRAATAATALSAVASARGVLHQRRSAAGRRASRWPHRLLGEGVRPALPLRRVKWAAAARRVRAPGPSPVFACCTPCPSRSRPLWNRARAAGPRRLRRSLVRS
jgi:hypothetical protein